MMATIASCNSDSNEVVDIEGDLGNCAVSSFSLAKDDSVLTRLDSVFFSIDLPTGEIFNADSLPVGTKIDKLIVKIGTASAKGCDLTFRIPGTDRDTTIDYIKSPKDSINFADGPVKLLVTSYDGLSKYEYRIKVNVHTLKPDTLYWSEQAKRSLPTDINRPEAQKAVEYMGKAYCLTTGGGSATLAVSGDPFAGDWEMMHPALPADADVNSLTASSDALYMLDASGSLFKSTDGLSWTATGAHMNHIYGGYEASVIGARRDADGWKHVSYPATTEKPVPAGCPVRGTGQMVTYVTKWSSTPMAIFVGGRDASGVIVGSTWGYDGGTWAKISTRDMYEIEDVVLFPYNTPRVDNSWRVSERSALIAMGGRYETEEGTATDNLLFISYDQGLTWNQASDYLQFKEGEPGFYGAQALVFNARLDASRSYDSGWIKAGEPTLPVWATPVPFTANRVSKPVDEWDCPFIYLFGGYDESGQLRNSLWRGVIRRFTFRPLY